MRRRRKARRSRQRLLALIERWGLPPYRGAPRGNPSAPPTVGDQIKIGQLVINVIRCNGDYRDVEYHFHDGTWSGFIGAGSASYRELQAIMLSTVPLDGVTKRDYVDFISGSTHHVLQTVAGRLRVRARFNRGAEGTWLREVQDGLEVDADLLSDASLALRNMLRQIQA